jgi:hypothetical protein
MGNQPGGDGGNGFRDHPSNGDDFHAHAGPYITP